MLLERDLDKRPLEVVARTAEIAASFERDLAFRDLKGFPEPLHELDNLSMAEILFFPWDLEFICYKFSIDFEFLQN